MTALPVVLCGKSLVVVDIEGNGQQPPEIIELAALPIDDQHLGAATDMQTWMIRPRKPITALVTRKVHGISDADVADCPDWSEVQREITPALRDRTLVAHHASVEHRVLSAHLPQWQPPMVLDTMKLARRQWPGLPGYGLGALIAHAGIDADTFADAGHHRAAYDTWCAWQLLLCLLEGNNLDWSDLVERAALPSFVPTNEPGGLW